MTILYHLATLPPKLPQAEAIAQELKTLAQHFSGETVYINPNQQSPVFVPRLLYGFHRLRQLYRWEPRVHLHHFYNPDPFPFPYLRWLRRPVIYSITCGVDEQRPNVNFFSRLAGIAVSDERSFKRLQSWGLSNVYQVQAGIESQRFTHTPVPLQDTFHLLVASAPWTRGQFQSKGIDALLAAAQLEPKLRLTFLWRGVLTGAMQDRVKRMNLAGQVEIIDGPVEVNLALARVHATVTLAARPGIIKAQPHSLLDSLAAGKPVLVSRAIPMADYVERVGCGEVVEQVEATAILAAVDRLRSRYPEAERLARQVGQRDFSTTAMVQSFQRMYEQILGVTF